MEEEEQEEVQQQPIEEEQLDLLPTPLPRTSQDKKHARVSQFQSNFSQFTENSQALDRLLARDTRVVSRVESSLDCQREVQRVNTKRIVAR